MSAENRDLLPSPLEADPQPYLKQLNSRDKQRREKALEAARRLSSDQLLSLTTAATSHLDRFRQVKKICNPFLWYMLLFPIGCIPLLAFNRFQPIVGWPADVLYTILLIPAVVLGYHQLTLPNRLFLALRTLLADRDDPCLLGQALELQIWGDEFTRRRRNIPWQKMAPTIERMVRRMTPGAYEDLTPPQKARLLQWFKDPLDNISLSLALLEMLKTISDKSAMDRVAKIAHSEAATLRQKQIREAAQECLTAMKGEQAKEQQGQVLLRASAATATTAAGTLLRPAVGRNAEATPEQLLRASDSDAQP